MSHWIGTTSPTDAGMTDFKECLKYLRDGQAEQALQHARRVAHSLPDPLPCRPLPARSNPMPAPCEITQHEGWLSTSDRRKRDRT